MINIQNNVMLIFSLLGMAVLLLFMSEIVDERAIRISGVVLLGLGAFFIGRLMYQIMYRKNYRR